MEEFTEEQIDTLINKIEERGKLKIKGVREPEMTEARGSITASSVPQKEEDLIEQLKQTLLEQVMQLIEQAINDTRNEFLNENITDEEIYNTFEEYVTNNNFVNYIRNIFNEYVYSARRAKVQSVSTSTISVKLLDEGGNTIDPAITVYPVEHLGSNALSGNVWPDLSANDVISVFKDMNGSWYTTFVFDDTTSCD